MIETPPAPEVWPTLPTAEVALLEQVATLRRENAALRAENAVLQARIRELEAGSARTPRMPPVPRLRTYLKHCRGRTRRVLAAGGVASQDTAGPSARFCQSSR
jgi:hypothetical protein